MEKQQSVFFMVEVDEKVSKNGLVLRCTSTNKSRFKLVVSGFQEKDKTPNRNRS